MEEIIEKYEAMEIDDIDLFETYDVCFISFRLGNNPKNYSFLFLDQNLISDIYKYLMTLDDKVYIDSYQTDFEVEGWIRWVDAESNYWSIFRKDFKKIIFLD